MDLAELLLLAAGLSMDAFAASVCKGLGAKTCRLRHAVLAGMYFGSFQALMPLLGWLLGCRWESMIRSVDHWIVFFLLSMIGIHMIRDAFSQGEVLNDDFGAGAMVPLALATSIDALAAGISFAFLSVRILPAAGIIGATAFLLSALGVRLGRAVGRLGRGPAELVGGLILMAIGLKILLEHLGWWIV